jgi:hypothetical protein
MTGRGTPDPVVAPSGFFVLRTPLGATPYLMQTLARARDGARPGTLAAALAAGDITRADADEYIAGLAGSQVLVADVRPQLVPSGAPAARDGTRPSCQGGRVACHA